MLQLPYSTRIYPNREHSFVLATFDKITEEPLLVGNAFATIYQQTESGGSTQSTVIVPRNANVAIEPGQVIFVLTTEYTGAEGHYVLLWEVAIDEHRKTTKEARFCIIEGPMYSLREGSFIDLLKVFLKDKEPELYRVDPQVERWDDDDLYAFLLRSLWDLNSFPPVTSFSIDGLPEEFFDILLMGGLVFSLYAQGILEIGRDFSYNDNGLSVTMDRTAKYMNAAQMLLSQYYQLKTKIKKAYAMAHTHWVGIKEQRMPISIRRPLSMLPHMANVFGRDATYL